MSLHCYLLDDLGQAPFISLSLSFLTYKMRAGYTLIMLISAVRVKQSCV